MHRIREICLDQRQVGRCRGGRLVSVLLVGLESLSLLVTLAVLKIVPPAVGVTNTVTVTLVPTLRSDCT